MEATSKTCRGRCGLTKPLADFYRNRGTYASRCKECVKADVSDRRRTDAGKASNERSTRAHHLRTLYGLTVADYDAMVKAQAGLCACGREDPRGRLAVDHVPNGPVRGLLCRGCNLALGYARHDPAVLRALADYLDRQQPPEWPVL